METTTTAADGDSFAKFLRVLEHIEAHPDGDLSLERLSRIAALSKYHFHRQFSAFFGITVHAFVTLARLKRASYRLAFRADDRVTEIALAAGYASPEAFARAFKKTFGQTPTEFRAQPRWERWHEAYAGVQATRPKDTGACVETVVFPETQVAVLEHRGDPRRLGDSLRRFIAWRKARRLPPRRAATFNLLYGDPLDTAPEHYRMDLCVATSQHDEGSGFVAKVIPGGRCATLRHTGGEDALAEAIRHLYARWLPASGEEPRDFPLFLRRVSFFPDVPEHAATTDIFLPLSER